MSTHTHIHTRTVTHSHTHTHTHTHRHTHTHTRTHTHAHTQTHTSTHTHTRAHNAHTHTHTDLARQAAKTDSCTCGPHKGSNPLHLVLAFCRVALSHSSRPRACLDKHRARRVMVTKGGKVMGGHGQSMSRSLKIMLIEGSMLHGRGQSMARSLKVMVMEGARSCWDWVRA